MGRFPFHTDAAHHRAPPRFVLLRIADGSETTTPTELVDFNSLSISRADVETLRREPWLVRGGVGLKFFSAILFGDGVNLVLRFDPGCMRPASGTNPCGHDILSDALAVAGTRRVDWRPGRMVVFDNWRFLHARPAVQPNDNGRILERILVTP
jgi:L-asparagine oxygenase